MDFEFSEEQLEFKKNAIRFAQKTLNDKVIERDRDAIFSRELWKKCADFGIQGSAFPEQYGGLNTDIFSTMLLMEGLGCGCKDSGLIFAINGQMWTVQMPILRFGSDEQKDRYLPKLCSGEFIGANGVTEPASGSDAFSLTTSAVREGDYYILNGTKTFCTMATAADVFMVFATVDKRKGFMGVTAFIVERGFPGFKVGRDIEKMGLRTAPMAELILEDCRVPAENRLGKEGNGAAIFEDTVEWERCCILASLLGGMERQLEECIQYSKERKQFGKSIGKYQSIANKIVDMKVRMDTARLLLYKVAWMKHAHGKATLDAAIVKLYLSESWVKSCLDAVQIHGGYGYTTEYEVERDLRDSIASTIYSGTSEIQKNIIARFLGL
ncbi:MAG: acyl-CoA dehydrogenase [Candidatus Schekmanbacteria bacterium RBG_16_38_10]|uniref:Acyl-CoA dehydrogenase n=1 Tax=Candidatus Schekmanbacteria bacterium RBG_16_38_10 TaxID=1817879 RepID=A0A1F7S1Y9_9BACT|nr:MAG: acyl-CoA dehydrogenase [Candidatus Schekmanbacteria bacterium RBG_16_38_10]